MPGNVEFYTREPYHCRKPRAKKGIKTTEVYPKQALYNHFEYTSVISEAFLDRAVGCKPI